MTGIRSQPPSGRASAGGETFRARKPFSVEIVPERLVAKLRRS